MLLVVTCFCPSSCIHRKRSRQFAMAGVAREGLPAAIAAGSYIIVGRILCSEVMPLYRVEAVTSDFETTTTIETIPLSTEPLLYRHHDCTSIRFPTHYVQHAHRWGDFLQNVHAECSHIIPPIEMNIGSVAIQPFFRWKQNGVHPPTNTLHGAWGLLLLCCFIHQEVKDQRDQKSKG